MKADGNPSTAIVPLRRGIGLRLYDLVVLTPPALRKENGLGAGVVSLLEKAGFRATLIPIPPDTGPGPAADLLASAADTHGLLILCREGSRPTGLWLTWVLGYASALGLKTALLPVARKDAGRELWRLPHPLRGLPYVGTALAVGDREPSFWVLPPDKPPESREALNLEYWLHHR